MRKPGPGSCRARNEDQGPSAGILLTGCFTVAATVGLMILAFCMGRYLFPSGS